MGQKLLKIQYFRPIYPCRSLCTKVRAGCEGRMSAYGFPWPPMLDCAKFPEDNDMCITAQAAVEADKKQKNSKGKKVKTFID